MRRFLDKHFEAIWITVIFIVLGLVVVFPVCSVFNQSFCEVKVRYGKNIARYVGLNNYRLVFSDPFFWRFLRQGVVYTAGSVGISLVLGLMCAMLLDRIARLKALFRGMILLPWVIPPVVAAVLWRWLLNDTYGLVNAVIRPFHAPINWLGSPRIAMISLVAVDAWTRVPFATIYMLAGLQGIPEEIYDAAKVDGAGTFARFRYVTLPYLRPVIVTVVLILSIFVFRTYEMIGGLTSGGPARYTETLTSYIFKNVVEYYKTGYSSALSVVMLVIIVLFSIVYLRAFYRKVS